jgi:hypothetical protein
MHLPQVWLFWFLAKQVRMFDSCTSVRIALHANSCNKLD